MNQAEGSTPFPTTCENGEQRGLRNFAVRVPTSRPPPEGAQKTEVATGSPRTPRGAAGEARLGEPGEAGRTAGRGATTRARRGEGQQESARLERAGRWLRVRGGGGARSVGADPTPPRPAPRFTGRAPPGLALSPPSAVPPSSSSSGRQAAWRRWRRGSARRTAAAARPSSSVPPASSWASRARTSARR